MLVTELEAMEDCGYGAGKATSGMSGMPSPCKRAVRHDRISLRAQRIGWNLAWCVLVALIPGPTSLFIQGSESEMDVLLSRWALHRTVFAKTASVHKTPQRGHFNIMLGFLLGNLKNNL
ncbi:MAG: hypothetical protein LBP99_02360 [Azoarcus sp.]|jgi:hypothetical protein|nr:hypothetical protein [Azoarcus sp.]